MDGQYFDYRFYSYIYENEELKEFFDKLTESYLKRLKSLDECREIEIKGIHLDFAPIKEQIKKLEQVGIKVEEYDCWLDPNEYNCTFDDFNINILCFAKFNGFTLNEDEIKELKDYSVILNANINPDLIPGAQSVLDKDYFKKSLKQTLKTDKKLKTELKKSKKPKKLYSVSDPMVTQYYTDLEKIERISKRIESNKLEEEKYRFLMNLTSQQRKEILKTCYETICNYKEECINFIKKRNSIIDNYDRKRINILSGGSFFGLDCIMSDEKIKLKLFKEMMGFFLSDIEKISKKDICFETRLVIDFFIRINEEYFTDWYYDFENNFDCFFEVKEKTKKTNCR